MIPPLARRFVAGETDTEGLAHAGDVNDRGVGAIINHLGEHYEEHGPADRDTAIYEQLVDDIADTDLRACVSVKSSQLGLLVSEGVFRENLARIVDRAAARDVFVWLDMEDHTTTDATLSAFERETTRHGGGVGVCVQANLRRTNDDLRLMFERFDDGIAVGSHDLELRSLAPRRVRYAVRGSDVDGRPHRRTVRTRGGT